MSASHPHRTFKAMTGLTPKAYAAAKRAERVRRELARTPSVTDAIYGAGFHSTGRFYGVLWMVLLVGALPAVAFTLFFSNKHAWVQAAMAGSVMLIVLLSLLVTLSLQHRSPATRGSRPMRLPTRWSRSGNGN